MHKFIFIVSILLLFSSCVVSRENIESSPLQENSFHVVTDKRTIIDSTRNREIPIVIYKPKQSDEIIEQKFVILSHGYGQNRGVPYLGYSFIAENLAKKGCLVVSIQHESSTDDLLPMVGEMTKVRMPNWEKGVKNIEFTISSLKKGFSNLDDKNLILIGHSNGGDMSVLFAEKHPEIVSKVITLDNRRMPFPRVSKPRFYSLRSIDSVADPGVLPNDFEQEIYGIVIQQTSILHNDMCNSATKSEKEFMKSIIEKWIFE